MNDLNTTTKTNVVLICANLSGIWTVGTTLEEAQAKAAAIGNETLDWVPLSSSEYNGGQDGRYKAYEVPADREWEVNDAAIAEEIGRFIGFYQSTEATPEEGEAA